MSFNPTTTVQGADGYIAFFTGKSALAGDNDLHYNRETGLLTINGGITSPGAGTNTEQFGKFAAASGNNSTAIGYSSSATGSNSIAIGAATTAQSSDSIVIGYNISSTIGSNTVLVGNGSSVDDGGSVVIGITASGSTQDTAIGFGAVANDLSVVIGYIADGLVGSTVVGNNASSTGRDAVVLGRDASNTGIESIAIGLGATIPSGYQNSLAIGAGATVTGNNLGEIGTVAKPIALKLYGNLTTVKDLNVGGNIVNKDLSETFQIIKQALDGYALTTNEIKSAQEQINQTIIQALDGYATDAEFSGLNTTVTEHYNQLTQIVQDIRSATDGYAQNSTLTENLNAQKQINQSILQSLDGYALTANEIKSAQDQINQSIIQSLDGYAQNATVTEHYNQFNQAIQDITSTIDGYAQNITVTENFNAQKQINQSILQSLDGYAQNTTVTEHYNQFNQAIQDITSTIDGYATDIEFAGLNTTVTEHYNQLTQIIQDIQSAADGYAQNITFVENKNAQQQINQSILQSLDGYALSAVVPDTAATGDGYVVFFTSVGRNIAGDNDLHYNRETGLLTISGNISSPNNEWTATEKFGALANAGGDYSTALGYNANATTDFGVAIGYNSSAQSSAVTIGYSATSSGPSCVVIGYNSSSSSYGVALGYNADTTTNGIAIGYGSQSMADESIAIGSSSSTSTYTNALAIGVGATVSANNSGEIGTATKPISLKLYSNLNVLGNISVGGDIVNSALAETFQVIQQSLDGYAQNSTVTEHYNQFNQAIQDITSTIDGYATDVEFVGLSTTVTEHYNQFNQAIQDITSTIDGYAQNATLTENLNAQKQVNQSILQSLDGYAIVSNTTSTGDGYIAFFTNIGMTIAGDNDLFWDRTNNRFGIGTSSPSAALHVSNGSMIIDGSGLLPVSLADLPGRIALVTDVNSAAVSPNQQIVMLHSSNDVAAPQIAFRKTRGATNSYSAVSALDNVGTIAFQAYDGGTYRNAAYIQTLVESTFGGAGEMPGRLSFWVTPDASTTAVELMRINASTSGGMVAVYGDLNVAGAIGNKDLSETFQVIRQALDGYATVSNTAATGDGYLAFFTGVGDNIAGDNDLYWDRVNSKLTISGISIGGFSPTERISIQEDVNAASGAIIAQNINTGSSASSYIQISSDSADIVMQSVSAANTTTLAGGAVADRAVIYTSSAASNGLYIGTHAAAQLVFSTNNTERMRILSGGNVGIGTNNPTQQFEITQPTGASAYPIQVSHTDSGIQTALFQNEGRSAFGTRTNNEFGLMARDTVGITLRNYTAGLAPFVGIGTRFPIEALTVNGTIALQELATTEAPVAQDGYGKIYVADDNTLHYKNGIGIDQIVMSSSLPFNSAGADGYLAFYTDTATLAGDNDLRYDRITSNLTAGMGLSVISDDASGTAALTSSSLELGSNRTVVGNAWLDLIGETGNPDYSARLIRYSAANANVDLLNQGTGGIRIIQVGDGTVSLWTNNQSRFSLSSSSLAVSVPLSVNSTTTAYPLEGLCDASGFSAFFRNGTTNNINRQGLRIQCGETSAAGSQYPIRAYSNDGTEIGGLWNNGGTFQVYDISDQNRKEDIASSKIDAVEIINDIEIKEYRYITGEVGTKGKKHSAGFIAQNLKDAYPEAVFQTPDGNWATNRTALIPVLIKAIQEQQKLIEELTNRIEQLENA